MSKTLTDLRHARSQKDFPHLHLESDEYVVLTIARSRAGLILVWFAEIVLFLLLTLCLILFDSPSFAGSIGAFNSALRTVVFLLYFVLIISGVVGTRVYLDNKMYITNRRIFQYTSNALFHRSVNIIELSHIEDVSFTQAGIIETTFRFGTIRMSTVGDETTYTFRYVDTPTDEVDTIIHLIHNLKETPKETSKEPTKTPTPEKLP